MIKIPFPGRQMSIGERNAWTAILCEIKQAIKNKLHLRNTFGDKIEIAEEYLFYEGTKEQVKAGTARLITKSKGHIVNTGLIPIVNLLATSRARSIRQHIKPNYRKLPNKLLGNMEQRHTNSYNCNRSRLVAMLLFR